MQRISILGCGWLGFPLAKELLESGFQVKGSVTTHSKLNAMRDAGIEPYQLVLDADMVEVDRPGFFDTDVVILAIPPRRIDSIETIFPGQIRQLITMMEEYQVPRLLFISSTSVYNEVNREVTEGDVMDPDKPSGKALILSEELLMQNPNFKTTVLRFGGLIGAERNPARFLSRKRDTVSGSKPVNLIHLDDCLGIIQAIIDQQVWGEIFNACSPEHPTRKAFYMKAAAVSGIPAPKFNDDAESFKIVDSTKLIQKLNFQFKYQSPVDYLETIHES